ncbi:hypothetical protein LCGC14_3135770 [marine sediment metagenome]|uniref:Uncharacterized protein n=1 Tax=marine sediment metagenome TaxID=412755 RepID=A0A0F8YMT0_9ZZZZ
MSKVTHTFTFHGFGYERQCHHTGFLISPSEDFKYKEGDDIPCPTCAEVKAARTEIMIATGLAEYERGRLTAFEEGEQSTIAFIQSHFYDRPDEIECLEKDIADAFQILTEKP